MAAGLETAVDTRGHANLVGNIVEKVLLARQLAENERKFAAKKAEEAGTSLEEAGIERGHFFKKALFGEFGGNYLDKKKKDLKNVVKKYRIAKRITKDPKKAFKFIKPLLQKKVTTAQTKMFRAKFDYTYSDNINRPEPQTPLVGGTAKKIQKATGGKKRISNEELLKTLTSIVDSLNKTAETIGRNTSGLSSGVISSIQSQHQLIEQLKLKNSSIEDKLDDIAKAISTQTQFQKKTIVKAKTARTEANLETAKDIAQTEVADDTETPEDETLMAQLTQNVTPTTNIINNQTLQSAPPRAAGGYPSLSSISKPGMDIPGYESGGVVNGPASGYLAKVPKGSTIIPINNNYTQGKPSAIDGKIRQKPNASGTSSVGGRFGFGITNMMGIAGGGTTESSKMAQPLIDAMSLPMMVAGGSILSTVTKLVQSMGSEGESIAPEIESLTRPIADVFGLPPTIVKRIKSSVKAGGLEEKEEDKESNKNILSKLMDGFGALLDKLKESINTNANDTTPPSGGNLSPVSLEGFTQKEISDLGRMVYAEAGASEEGAAHVLNTILNRYRQIKQGKATPQAWGVRSGVTAEKMTITDLLYASGQFQPISDKRFDKVSAEQGTEALNAAIKGGGLDPSKIKANAITAGMSEEEASRLAVADTFYNPTVSSNKPFKNAPVVNTKNKHAFMSSPNTGFTPQDLSRLQPVVQNTPPPVPTNSPQPVQKITQHFGYKEHDRVNFEYNGEEYHAYRGKDDWALFKGRGIGATLLDRSGGKNKEIVNQFMKIVQQQTSAPAPQEVSFNPPPAANGSVAKAEGISTPLDTNGSSNIVAMMIPQAQPQKQTASTALPSSAETSTTGRSFNPLDNSGLYNTNVLA
ncbi:MAG: hypothetical protein ACO21H_02740 [Sediminibacterium sp.]